MRLPGEPGVGLQWARNGWSERDADAVAPVRGETLHPGQPRSRSRSPVLIHGESVGALGLGTAQLAFTEIDRAQAVRTVHAALDAGVRLIDTALAYNRPGRSSYAEETVRRALSDRPPGEAFVATKGGHYRAGDEFPIDGRPDALRRDCETSLRELGVERIDLYQLHHVDPAVPFEDSVGALEELRRGGKIAQVGLSNVTLDLIDRARSITDVATVQNRLSVSRPSDLGIARSCAERGIVYLAYSPLEGTGADGGEGRMRVARRLGVSPQRVALAWLIAQSPNILPLVGASRPETIEDSAGAALLRLDAADLAAISGDSRPTRSPESPS